MANRFLHMEFKGRVDGPNTGTMIIRLAGEPNAVEYENVPFSQFYALQCMIDQAMHNAIKEEREYIHLEMKKILGRD